MNWTLQIKISRLVLLSLISMQAQQSEEKKYDNSAEELYDVQVLNGFKRVNI